MAGSAVAAVTSGRGRRFARRLGWGILGFVGYMLSPLSPWNDAFVNVPLAYAAAKLLRAVLGVNEFLGFQLGYIASNVAGLVLMALSGQALARGDSSPSGRRWLLRTVLLSTLYGVAASIVLASLGLIQPP